MQRKVELLLHWFNSTSPDAFYPAFRSLSDIPGVRAGFTDLPRQVRVMEKLQLLEKLGNAHSRSALYRITEKGRLMALGGRDPERQWSRHWDGRWRFFLFGIPERERTARVRLRTSLQRAHFGCLQRSVWISPDCLKRYREEWFRLGVSPHYMTLLEGQPVDDQKTHTLTQKAWDFTKINRSWEQLARHLDLLEAPHYWNHAGGLTNWFRKEHVYWHQVISMDPLLPSYLLPKDYPGMRIWRARKRAIKSFAKRIKAAV